MTIRMKLLAGVAIAFSALPGAALAQDKTITGLFCGDKMQPAQAGYIAEWEKNNPGFKVQTEVVGWDQCQDKATTLAAAGTPYGFAYVGSRTLKQFAQNDLIVPITMSEEEQKSYFPFVVGTVSFDGQQWGIPVAFSTKSFYWNKDLFAQAGLDPEKPPKTFAEEVEYAKTIKEKTGIPGYGLVAKTFDNTMHQFLHWVYSNDGTIIDADGNITLDSKQNLETLTALKEIVPYSEEGPTSYEQNEVRAIFLDGKVAMIQASVAAKNLLKEANKFKWGVAELPQGPSAKGPGTLLITDSLAVFKGTGVEDKAIDLAKFMTSTENQPAYEAQEGLTPLRPGPAVDKLIADDAGWKPFIDGIQFGGPEPLFTDYKGFQNTMIEMVQSVVAGSAEPADALKKAAADLEQYK